MASGFVVLDSRTGRRSSMLVPTFPTTAHPPRGRSAGCVQRVGDCRRRAGHVQEPRRAGDPAAVISIQMQKRDCWLCASFTSHFFVSTLGSVLASLTNFHRARSPPGPKRPAPSCVNLPGAAAAAGPSSHRLWSLRVSSFVSDAS